MTRPFPLVPVYEPKAVTSWPKNEDASDVAYAPLDEALAVDYADDAHFCCYSVPSVPKRLSTRPPAWLKIDGGVRMVTLAVDIDDPVAHPLGEPARDAWRAAESFKLTALLAAHPGFFCYDTRGGYRLVAAMEREAAIASDADYIEWRAYYLAYLGYLSRRYDILGDVAMRDWTRAYRLPHATRGRDKQPQQLPTSGALGWVDYQPADEDLAEVQRLASVDRAWAQAVRGLERQPAERANPGLVQHDPADLPALRVYASEMTARRDAGKAGDGGGQGMLLACRFLYRELALPDDAATRKILDAYAARCDPPWEDDSEIEHKIEDGRDSDRVAVGSGLAEFRVWRAFQELAAPSRSDAPVQSADPDALRVVRLTHKEADAADEVLKCMSERNGVYCRSDQLVAVMPGELPRDRKRLVPLAKSIVRGLITKCCHLEAWSPRAKDWEPSNPPPWLVDQIYDRVHWPGIPPITDFVDAPVLDANGAIVQPGYNASSGVYYAPSFEALPVADAPTREEALAAAERVMDLLCDFPIPVPAHRTAWLAGCLTQACRARINGPIPMFLIDGNVRSTGKTNLVDMICQIAHGQKASKTPEAKDPDEFRKQFSSAVMAGDTVTCFDNLTGAIGGAALDAALTNDGRWSDRLLGTNKRVDKVVRMTVFATGNNIPLRDDLVRRVLYIRLQSDDEQPWLRDSSKFRYDLSGERGAPYILARRPELVRDVLTILRAYEAAGRPAVALEGWGSFESWSRAVRAPIVWLGLPDPAAGRRQLAEEVDDEPAHISQLMSGLEKVQARSPGGFTSAAVAAACASFMPEERNDELKEAVAALAAVRPGAQPTSKQIGYLLKKLRDRPVGGRKISRAGHMTHEKIVLWLVKPAKPPIA